MRKSGENTEKESKYSHPHFLHILNTEKIWKFESTEILNECGKLVQILPSAFSPYFEYGKYMEI